MRKLVRTGAALALALNAAAAQSEVKNANASGFEVGGTIEVAATPAHVWQSLGLPSRWWDKAHTFSGDARNLSLRPVPGGCFCERLASGGGVEHLRVIHSAPNQRLVLSGALGPLQTEPVNGVLTVTLIGRGGSTSLTWAYSVSGLRKAKGDVIASPVDQVLSAQFASLARYAADSASRAPQRR